MTKNKPSERHRPDTSKNGLMKRYPLPAADVVKDRKGRTSKILSRFKSLDVQSEPDPE